MSTAATERSLRRELREFVQEEMSREDSIAIETLVRKAHSYFNGDEWVREALIREGLNALIPRIAQHVRHDLRRSVRHADGDSSRRERMASVFEYVGGGFSKSILAMRRPEHLFAAQEREVAAAGHLRWAGFHRAVAALHQDDQTATADLEPTQVASLWKEHIEVD